MLVVAVGGGGGGGGLGIVAGDVVLAAVAAGCGGCSSAGWCRWYNDTRKLLFFRGLLRKCLAWMESC